MKQQIKRWAWIGAGWFFILLGIAGLFLPFLQGILFLLIGLIILSSEYVWAHRLLERLRQKFPRLASRVDRLRTRVHARWNRTPAGES